MMVRKSVDPILSNVIVVKKREEMKGVSRLRSDVKEIVKREEENKVKCLT